MLLGPGTVLAGYTVERLLGSGGMGAVYLARHPRLTRLVALKVLADSLAADTKARSAFDREAELVARLDHPNIVPVYDRSRPQDEALWLSMRYIEGVDAASLVASTPGGLAADRAVRLIADAAHALDFAIDHGVLHRDVKPANLMIELDPRHGERAVLTDFGIARALDDTATMSVVAATLAYAAPERFADRPADHRSDIYSLGCTLFELLTGTPPFPRASQAAVIAAHLNDPPPVPSRARPGLPTSLDAVIAKALAKNPVDRYPSCTALAEASTEAITATVPIDSPPATISAGPAGTRDRASAESERTAIDVAIPEARRSVARPITRRRMVIGGSAALVLGVAGYLGTTRLRSPEPVAVPDGRLTGLAGGAKAIAYSPDRSMLAVGDSDAKTHLWTLPTRASMGPGLDRFETSSNAVKSVAFSPDGTLLAVNFGSGMRIWDTRTRQPYGNDYQIAWSQGTSATAVPFGDMLDQTYAESIAFRDNGTLVTCGSSTVTFWNPLTHRRSGKISITGHEGVLSPDGTTAAVSGYGDRGVQLWNTDTAESGVTLSAGPTITLTVLSPNGTVLAAACDDKTVRLWNTRTGQPMGSPLTGHTDAVTAIAFSPDNSTLATGSTDTTIRLWDLRADQSKGSPLTGHNSRVEALAFSPDGTQLASGSHVEHEVQLWRLRA
ncbi:WD40 repeat domain-containing serine/threonine protein kinase [Nocardia sp. NPDC004722]